MKDLKAPFPWFGGKSRIADEVWTALGPVNNYVEPFSGSLAVLLLRPDDKWQTGAETVNDADAYVSNFWRALSADPEQVAHFSDWPVNECVPSGTMIATPNGNRPIESIKEGERVLGYENCRVVESVVVATRQSEASALCEIGGLRLTPNHPVWTSSGYIPASDLRYGHVAAILAHDRDRTEVDYIRIGRPSHGTNSICGSDVSRTQQAGHRTFIACKEGSQDAPGLLDMVIAQSQSEAVASCYRAELWKRFAGARAFLDCSLPDLWQLGQPYRWGRRHAWVKANSRTNFKVQSKDDRTQISRWASLGNAWKTSHARSCGENSFGFNRSSSFSGCLSENSASSQREGHELLHCPISGGAQRSSPIGAAQSEHFSYNHKSKSGCVCRNGGNIPVNNCGGKMSRGNRNIRKPIHSQGVLLQGPTIQLSEPVAVFNIQTTTGNYFANRVLVHNCDLVARHLWLVNDGKARIAKMESDPDFFDAKVAGWWVWGINSWIGSGWCSGTGPHMLIDGEVTDNRQRPHLGNAGQGVNRQRPHLGNAGQGVNRKRPHLGNAGHGVNRQLPHLGDAGQGVNRQLPHLENQDKGGQLRPNLQLQDYFFNLAERLRRVRVCCGDWSRVVTPGALAFGDTVGVFLDPPYLGDVRAKDLYRVDDHSLSHEVREWAIENGDNPRYRIVLAGYEDEHAAKMPASWRKHAYKANRAYGSSTNNKSDNNSNRHNERLWMSPGCLDPEPMLL